MSSIALQVLLLIAISTSQVVGGNSCCCLTRAVSAVVAVKFSGAAAASVKDEASNYSKQNSGWSCPKCAARKASGSQSQNDSPRSLHSQRDQLDVDSQCRCVKHAITVFNSKDSLSEKSEPIVCFYQGSTSTCVGKVSTRESHRYQVPGRFGGPSWQAIACIWNI